MKINELLGPHQVIGWDVDGTILDHPNAPVMHRYIIDNPEKRHIIVTFRSHGWQNEIFSELAAMHDVFAGPEHFDGILNVPDDVFIRFQRHSSRVLKSQERNVRDYIEWKGRVCKEAGITVLVDDNPHHVLPGCDMHGILHIHPDDFS